ncbi:hypothetical protein AMTR_s00841p00011080, partial [Amborella trichopoda]
ARDDVDNTVACFFYAHGIFFNVTKGPRFYEMIYAVNNGPKGYVPTKYQRIRTTLLDKERSRINQALGV